MLDLLIGRLEGLGLLHPGDTVHCNVNVRLDNALVDVYDDRGRYYHLRMTEAYDLDREHRIALAVSQAFGLFVPQPVAFIREGRLSCIVFEGVDFKVVSGPQLCGARPDDRLASDLVAFFERASSVAVADDGDPTVAQLVDALRTRYRGTDHEALVQRVLSVTDVGKLGQLKQLRQHGDFVLNNLGMRPAGLFIFDWEDYGRVCVPGFDLAVLLGSAVDFNPARVRALRKATLKPSDARQIAWFGDACRAIGTDAQSFWGAAPFYLLLFLWLKDRYSEAIRLKVARAIQGLL